MTDEAIRFTATVFKLQTLIDGGWRLYLDIQQPTDDKNIMELARCKQPGVLLECAAVVIDNNPKESKNARNSKKIHI